MITIISKAKLQAMQKSIESHTKIQKAYLAELQRCYDTISELGMLNNNLEARLRMEFETRMRIEEDCIAKGKQLIKEREEREHTD